MNTLGKMLKKARYDLDLTLVHVAAEIGVSKAMLCAYEAGAAQPLTWRVPTVSKVLNLTIEQVVLACAHDQKAAK